MSEEQVQGFGDYHPEAAHYTPYNDAMAAWYNQVKSMQEQGALPVPAQEPESAPETPERVPDPASQEDAESPPAEPTPQAVPDPGEQDNAEAYDPAEHTSPDVLYYLKVCDYDEAVRILDAEEHGKNRKGILNLKSEILAQAWTTNTKAADSAP